MFASNYLLERAFYYASKNQLKDAKDYLNFYMEDIKELKCHDRLVFGEHRMCGGSKPNDTYIYAPISWEVLEKRGNRILVVSEFCLDWNFYDGNCLFLGPAINTTWEKSTIREDLNTSFFENSFCEYEKKLIVTTEVESKPNPIHGNDGGGVTHDRIFLLSYDEILKYYSERVGNPLSDEDTECIIQKISATDDRYFNLGNSSAKTELLMADPIRGRDGNKDKTKIYREAYSWWLRTPGYEQKDVCLVTHSGLIDFDGISSSADEIGVRPAMWIDLDIAKELICKETDK